jgi:hypothetical protein
MTGLTDTAARAELDAIAAAYPYLGLFNTVGLDDGTGFTEVSAAEYVRFDASSAWFPADGSGPSSKTNSLDVSFGPAQSDWDTIVAIGLFSLAFGGTLGAWDYLGSFPWLPCTISNSSPGMIITDAMHMMSAGDLCVYSTEFGGTSPTFSQSNLIGLLTVAHATTNVIDVTNAGLPVNTSGTGSGMIRKVTPQKIDTVTNKLILPAGSLRITSA